MKINKPIHLDFIVDKLTNSIQNTISGDSFATEVLRLTKADLKQVTKKNGWNFNWTSPSGNGGSVIRMYYCALMANGTGNTAGDKSITGNKTGTMSGGSPLSLSISSKKNVSCFGGNDGSATVAGTGGSPPYSYKWSNGKTTNSVNSLIANTYKVTVSDATNAMISANVIITQPDSFTVSVEKAVNPIAQMIQLVKSN